MNKLIIALLFLLIFTIGCSTSQTCPKCNGTGQISLDEPICNENGCIIFETCPQCNGTGIINGPT